mmetsp:Transcript_2195/g.3492  ORF Transcript_2195/g.3492 Transcript_2195/m.3492 type:complete len:324 (-) Transcript_2195:203-1174(-)
MEGGQDDTTRKEKTKKHQFVCIECLAPSPSLYKIHPAGLSVKLTRCSICNAVVDPYIERELLLVLMDTMLHRKNAFRHLLFHRRLLDPKYNAAETTIQSLLAQAFCAVVMDAYIKYDEVLMNDSVGGYGSSDYGGADANVGSNAHGFNVLPELIAFSCIEYTAMLFGCITAALVYCACLSMCRKNAYMHQLQFINLFLAVNMPAIFLNSIAIFFLIWENTVTIRALSHLLVLSFQRLALQVVLERSLVVEERRYSKSEKLKIKPSYARNDYTQIGFVVSIFVLIVGLYARARAMAMNRYCADFFSHRPHYGVELFELLKEGSI